MCIVTMTRDARCCQRTKKISCHCECANLPDANVKEAGNPGRLPNWEKSLRGQYHMGMRFSAKSIAVLTVLLAFASVTPRSRAQVPPSSQQSEVPPAQLDHRLHLFHIHTGERLDIVFRHGDSFIPAATAKLDYFLRDHRTGEVRHFDPHIYDILEELTHAAGHPDGEIDIVCGYRTEWSNEFLRARTAGVAKNSLHLRAEAIDLRMPGVDTYHLREAALSLQGGGVGYYPHSDFIHVDVGRVRQWCFNCGSALHKTGD